MEKYIRQRGAQRGDHVQAAQGDDRDANPAQNMVQAAPAIGCREWWPLAGAVPTIGSANNQMEENMNDFPEGMDPFEARLTLLIEAWLISTQINFRHDTADQMFLLTTLRGMADDLRSSHRSYLAKILDGWIDRLEAGSREFSEALSDFDGGSTDD